MSPGIGSLILPNLKADRLNRALEKPFKDAVVTNESSLVKKATASKVSYSRNRKGSFMEITTPYFDVPGVTTVLLKMKRRALLGLWLKDQARFPALPSYNTKLSTADVERCISARKRATVDFRGQARIPEAQWYRQSIEMFQFELRYACYRRHSSGDLDHAGEDNRSANNEFMEPSNASDGSGTPNHMPSLENRPKLTKKLACAYQKIK